MSASTPTIRTIEHFSRRAVRFGTSNGSSIPEARRRDHLLLPLGPGPLLRRQPEHDPLLPAHPLPGRGRPFDRAGARPPFLSPGESVSAATGIQGTRRAVADASPSCGVGDALPAAGADAESRCGGRGLRLLVGRLLLQEIENAEGPLRVILVLVIAPE